MLLNFARFEKEQLKKKNQTHFECLRVYSLRFFTMVAFKCQKIKRSSYSSLRFLYLMKRKMFHCLVGTLNTGDEF